MPGLGTSFGRGGATTFQQDLQNSDCIVIMGSNMAENHPVGFQWVVEAKRRGAKVFHVDPRFTRTSALADRHIPLREYSVKYRRPYGTEWEALPLDEAMDMIADRIIATRAETWEDADDQGRRLRRTLGLVNLGGATLDNEENYAIKKLMTALGVVQVENQARI